MWIRSRSRKRIKNRIKNQRLERIRQHTKRNQEPMSFPAQTKPSHDILVLRDDDMGSTYLASVGNEPLERLEREAGVELSWL